MKKRIFIFMLALFFLAACGYEVGNVRLIADGVEHEPYIYTLHAMFRIDGGMVSASGAYFFATDRWLETYTNDMQEVPYADNLQIVIDGRHGEVNTGQRSPFPAHHDGMQIIAVRSAGEINALLPDAAGTYLVYVDVIWSGRGQEFTALRYVFKIIR